MRGDGESRALDEGDARAACDADLYRAVFEANSAVKLLIDPASGLIADANAAAVAFYGYTKAELVGMPITAVNVLPPELVRAELVSAREERRTFFRFRHRLASGEIRDVEVHSGPLVHEGRTLLLSIIHDVTERYRLEERLVQAQTLEAMGRLAGGVAHDFNNLLTVILAFSESIADGSREGERAIAAASHVVRAARRAADLTQKLLTFGRGRVGQAEHVAPNLVIADLEGVLRALLGERHALELALDPETGQVLAEPGLFVQVVTNLVRNAGEAMTDPGTVRVSTRAVFEGADAHVELSVTDDGPGIPEEALPHVFEPYYSTKRRGSGLGLATVYGIVRQASGTVHVSSVPGRTTFRVRLPRVELDGPQTAEIVAPQRGRLRVLVAEDDDDVRAAFREQLVARGHDVVAVEDGERALARFVEASADAGFDALVTDVRMPRMHGPALASAVRARDARFPIVFVTGHDAGLLDDTLCATAYTRVITKPCTSEALEHAITVAIAGARANVEAPARGARRER